MKLQIYILSAFMMLSNAVVAQTDDVLLGWVKFNSGSTYNLGSNAELITIPASFSVDVYDHPDIYLELMNQRIDDKGYGEYLYINNLGDGYIVAEIQANTSGVPRSFTIRGTEGGATITINQE